MEEDTPPLDEMRLLAEERQGDNSGVLSVSEISSALKRHVEQGFGHVRIRGEISGFKRATSGHLYLSLKDENAKIDGVMWKGNAARIPFVPQDGVEIIAAGKLTTYPGRSSYQIVIDSMEIAGEGALLALLAKLKAKLQAEGLFDPARKRPLPFLPRTIGVVTSPTGAVIRDILHRLADRCPTRVIVWPVLVQGHGSAEQVAAAVSGFSAMQGADRPDLIIVARGGGSIEDLWAFNEEVVVRAVATSTIPVISAVGHETDTTLCDFAADVRAPTPTAAAELAVPVRAELLAGLQSAQARALRAVRRYAERADERLIATARRLPSLDTLLGPQRQKVDDFSDRLRRGLSHRLSDARGDLARVSGALRPAMLTQRLANAEQSLTQIWRLAESLHPEKPLQRGYVLVKDRQGGVVSSVAKANRAKMLTLTFADGEVSVRVEQEGRPAYDRPKPEQPSLL
ncbi:MAG: exodeoxyribonuclease VII large subunit [Sphingomonadales bacterium]|nr:exodeoxyribonuclease VII large subunit [Sphingomonadales bacterium]MBK6492369.1 exodeoxyribonuclease VII large subunit [Sphingomonadales bacterium]MBK6720762.1 exodeoxyribonuclease VII large subunit [Sphingomonadales bacterium]MBK8274135.1 exodeoxyribonuclease VII large subunit [Sphingomonadales bacterium]MCC6479982.1 exodeoxyribonuclease VII large subunit [Sphingomonadaceae bacterium]